VAATVRGKLIEARDLAAAARGGAERARERAGLWVLLLVVGLAIVVASRLPQRPAKRQLPGAVGDPVLRRLDEAAEDDEPLTAEEGAAIADGLADLQRGDVTPLQRDGAA